MSGTGPRRLGTRRGAGYAGRIPSRAPPNCIPFRRACHSSSSTTASGSSPRRSSLRERGATASAERTRHFCGAGGLSRRLGQADFRIAAGTNVDPDACATYAHSFLETVTVCGDRTQKATGLRVVEAAGDEDIVVEGSPRQPYSGIRNTGGRRDRPSGASSSGSPAPVAANSYAVRPNRDVSLPSPGCLTPPRPREPRQGAPPSFRAGGYFARSRVSMRLANSWISDFCSTTVSSSFRSASAT